MRGGWARAYGRDDRRQTPGATTGGGDMFARVSGYDFPPERAEQVIRGFDDDPALETIPGVVEAYLLIDRAAGRALTMTVWESEDALRASEEAANRIRGRASGSADGRVRRVDRYEVALHDRFERRVTEVPSA
jgi:heme-degrading monooxygenase HmoA